MLLYFFIIFWLYYLLMAIVLFGWTRKCALINGDFSHELPFVSIVIAVRNEEKNISKLMDSMLNQDYPKDKYEVIVVDDNSTDNTAESIKRFIKTGEIQIRLLKSGFTKEYSGGSPKKKALLEGINASKGEIIVTTDGDCWFGNGWLRSLTIPFYNSKTMFVSGPVALRENRSLLSKIQALELSSLIGSGAAFIGLGYPLMCNGANLAFRKSAFQYVDGYSGNDDMPSGDDVFLMQKIHRSYPKSIVFQKDQNAVVYTLPQPSIFRLIHQRKRWASKWNDYLLSFSWAIPIFLVIHYVSFVAGFFVLFFKPQFFWPLSGLMVVKIILDYLILKKVMIFCNLRFRSWIFLLTEILYPFYALFIGISVHFGGYEWKGRRHKK